MNQLTRSLAILTAMSFAALAGRAQSCTDPLACNYDPNAGTPDAVCLEVEEFATHTDGVLAGMTTWRVYFHTTHPDDFVTVYGNSNEPLALTPPTSTKMLWVERRQADQPSVVPASPIWSSRLRHWPVPDGRRFSRENAPNAASPDQIGRLPSKVGATSSSIPRRRSMVHLQRGCQRSPDADGRVLLAQLTTDGDIGGTLNVEYFPAGGAATTAILSLIPPATWAAPTTPIRINSTAMATANDVDADQVCGKKVDDCIGSYDALGCANGNCTADADADGICDSVKRCVGALDACGVCNGPGAVEECGCSGIPAGDCDCDGNQLDALGVCGSGCTADTGTECATAWTTAWVRLMRLASATATAARADADDGGICDGVDDCEVSWTNVAICNSPGATGDCGCDDIPAGSATATEIARRHWRCGVLHGGCRWGWHLR